MPETQGRSSQGGMEEQADKPVTMFTLQELIDSAFCQTLVGKIRGARNLWFTLTPDIKQIEESLAPYLKRNIIEQLIFAKTAELLTEQGWLDLETRWHQEMLPHSHVREFCRVAFPEDSVTMRIQDDLDKLIKEAHKVDPNYRSCGTFGPSYLWLRTTGAAAIEAASYMQETRAGIMPSTPLHDLLLLLQGMHNEPDWMKEHAKIFMGALAELTTIDTQKRINTPCLSTFTTPGSRKDILTYSFLRSQAQAYSPKALADSVATS